MKNTENLAQAEESLIRILFSLLKLQNETWESKSIASF